MVFELAREQIKSVTLEALADEWAKIPRRHEPNARYASQCKSTLGKFVEFNSAGWHSVEVEWGIGAAGRYKITWDDVVTVEWNGDTSLGEAGMQMSILSPGGYTASDNDLSCFSGLDEVGVWRTG